MGVPCLGSTRGLINAITERDRLDADLFRPGERTYPVRGAELALFPQAGGKKSGINLKEAIVARGRTSVVDADLCFPGSPGNGGPDIGPILEIAGPLDLVVLSGL